MRLPVPKMSALVVSAIRSLRETRGSTSKDIMNYILSEHRAEDAAIQRQLNAALKRGLEYGILRRVNGHYTLKTDPFGVSPYPMIPEDKGKRKRRRRKGPRRMRHGRRGRRARRTRRSRRGRGGHRRTRKVVIKPERRGISARNKEMNARRLQKMDNELNDKCPSQIPPIERMHVENHEITEDRPANAEIPRRSSAINNNNNNNSNKERDRSRSRSRRSQSQPRQQTRQQTPPARSPSRSSESSDRDDQDDNRQED